MIPSSLPHYKSNQPLRFGAKSPKNDKGFQLVTREQRERDEARMEQDMFSWAGEEALLSLPSLHRLVVRWHLTKARCHELLDQTEKEEATLLKALAELEGKQYTSALRTFEVLKRLAQIEFDRGNRREAAVWRDRALKNHPLYGSEDVPDEAIFSFVNPENQITLTSIYRAFARKLGKSDKAD